MARQVAWYVFAVAFNIWNDNDDPVIQDKWACWLTDDFAVDQDTVSSEVLGDVSTQPVWCGAPTNGEGYVVVGPAYSGAARNAGNSTGVIAWDVTGGFVYR